MFSINNKIIVVTGAKGLLGSFIVNSLRKSGAIVYAADISCKEKKIGDLFLDITDEQSVKDAINFILKKHDKIDGWINNAYPRTDDWGNNFENIKIESWRKNIDMHLNGYFICSKIILEQMKYQNCGCLLNMSSIYGLVGPDFTIYEGTEITMPAAYAAIKGGLNNLTRYLASYYGKYQVRVNTISPGGIFDNQNKKFVENYTNKVPLKRMGTPNDIAAGVHFLLSDESAYITGHNLVIDGGWTII